MTPEAIILLIGTGLTLVGMASTATWIVGKLGAAIGALRESIDALRIELGETRRDHARLAERVAFLDGKRARNPMTDTP